MPEGDTIYRAAAELRPALVGAELLELSVHRTLPTRLPALPTPITEVRSIGKHLLVSLGSGHVLDSHLLMNGAWHLYGRGQRWRRSPGAMRARLVTASHQAVLFSTPAVALHPPGEPGPHPWERLGPDLCDPVPDVELIMDRVAGVDPATEVAELLLDQSVACGIGNVYKSEVLWARRIAPRTAVGRLEAGRIRDCYLSAHRLLRANRNRARRITHGTGLAVYRRPACPRCHGRVLVDRQGSLDRITYWCPRCQS